MKKLNSYVGQLAKPAIEIDDSPYTAGAAMLFGRDRFIGCRFSGLNAATIQRMPVGGKVTLTGHWERRIRTSDNVMVRCFCVAGLKRVKGGRK